MQWRQLALRAFRCPFCGPSLLVRWADHEHAIRCLSCAAGAVHLSLGAILRKLHPHARGLRVLELSARGPLVNYLRRSGALLTTSEFLDGVEPGSERDGVRCEDVQRLSFADNSFDLVTHTEVFEHVEDDLAGFRELFRVLAPGGVTLFSVPIDPSARTCERVEREGDTLRYLQTPEYHDDRLRGQAKVLSWRDYGGDIVDRLRSVGFESAWIESVPGHACFGRARPVIVAQRGRTTGSSE
jgi:SAM-dependent methyltransferase